MGNARFKILGWTLLVLVVVAVLVTIDQVLLFSVGRSQNHFLYCRIWKNSDACSEQIFKAHPKHGFLFDPGKLETYSRMESSPEIEPHTDYKLNENGFRISPPRDKQVRVRVNVFGDSFTFGAFLREKEHLVSRLNAAYSECEFRNYGVPGFNFLQMIGLSLDPQLVASSDLDIILFITDDIFERLTNRPLAAERFGHASTPFDLSRELGLKSGFSLRSPPHFLVKNSFFFQKLEQVIDQRFWRSVDREILADRLLEKLESRAKQTLYFHLPVPDDYIQFREGAWRLNQPESIAEASLGERVIEGAGSFEEFRALFFRGDGHPNPAGAKWIASKVMGKLKDICLPRENR